MVRQWILSRIGRMMVALGCAALAVTAAWVVLQATTALAQDDSLLVVKRASDTHVLFNETLTYTVAFTNTGTVAVTAYMTDVIPYGTHYVSGSAVSAPSGATYDPGPPAQVNWSGTLPPGHSTVVTFAVLVVEPETPGPLPLVNRAQVNVVWSNPVTVYSRHEHMLFLPINHKRYGP
jgi:uncharacterized repeat protein (TIGR01451 family)